MNSDIYKQINVNREFLADIFKCDVRTVQNYAKLNGMPREDDQRGEYPLFECLIWFINKQRNDIVEVEKDSPLIRARVAAIELNNKRKQKELEIQDGKWLDAETVELVNIAHQKMLIRNLNTIAPRLNKQLNGDSSTLAKIQAELENYKKICSDTPMSYYKNEIDFESDKNNVKF